MSAYWKARALAATTGKSLAEAAQALYEMGEITPEERDALLKARDEKADPHPERPLGRGGPSRPEERGSPPNADSDKPPIFWQPETDSHLEGPPPTYEAPPRKGRSGRRKPSQGS